MTKCPTHLTVYSDESLAPTGEDLVLTELAQLEPIKTDGASHEKDISPSHSITSSTNTQSLGWADSNGSLTSSSPMLCDEMCTRVKKKAWSLRT